jgi:hypothetical protein
MTVISHEPPPTSPNVPPKARGRAQIVVAGLVLLLVAGGLVGWTIVTQLLPGQLEFHSATDVKAGSHLRVDAPDAGVVLLPGGDGTVHVVSEGSYTYTRPTATATTSGQTTTVTAGCPQHERQCSLTVTISVPVAIAVQVRAQYGSVEAHGLTGQLDLTSEDGSIDVTNPTNVVTARSNNGSVTITGASSSRLTAASTNGSITVANARTAQLTADSVNGKVSAMFLDVPTTVSVSSVNGSVEVQVPDTVSYLVSAHTVSGGQDVTVPRDPSSTHVISATTTTGSVQVFS